MLSKGMMVFFQMNLYCLACVMNQFVLTKARLVHLALMQCLLRHAWDNAL